MSNSKPRWKCPNCGSTGSVHNIVLADAVGKALASTNLVTLAHSMAVAIFGHQGVMVQTVRREMISHWGSAPTGSFSRTFFASVIEQV